MRYQTFSKGESTYLLGYLPSLPSGETVTIALYDLSTGSAVALINNVCSEIGNTGHFRWDSSNIQIQPVNKTEYLYIMTGTTSGEVFSGKFIVGGYVDNLDISVEIVSSNVDGINSSMGIVMPTVQNLESSFGIFSANLQTANDGIVNINLNVEEILAEMVPISANAQAILSDTGNLLIDTAEISSLGIETRALLDITNGRILSVEGSIGSMETELNVVGDNINTIGTKVSIISGDDGVILATDQPNYAPALAWVVNNELEDIYYVLGNMVDNAYFTSAINGLEGGLYMMASELTDVRRIVKNKYMFDEENSKIIIYDDEGILPILTCDVFDKDGSPVILPPGIPIGRNAFINL